MKKQFYYYNSTLLFFFALALIGFNAFAQPTDECNSSFSGEGIPVSDQCNPRGFNVMNNYNANNAGGGAGCGSSNRKDAYWWFQGTGGTVVIRYKPTGGNVTAGLYNPTMSIHTGTCSTSGGTYSTCANDGSNGIMEVITMATNINTKYRIRIQNIASDNNYTMYGQICVMSLSTPNVDNKACNPYQLAVDSTAKPNYFQLSTFGTTTFSQTPSCGSYNANKRKAYFTVTMPSTDLVIETEKKGTGNDNSNATTSYINSAMAIYKVNGSGCGTGSETYSLIGCYTEGAPYLMAKQHIQNGTANGQVSTGQKLLIVVWTSNSATTNSYFGISAYTSTQCGNPLGLKNDFCENPARMYKAPNTTFSASTSGVFTPDQFPSGQTASMECYGGQNSIYVHNNSWYEFEADSTTEVFPFSADCQGIQAVIYQVSYTAQGCCNGFTKKSNCISQMAAGANAGTITANELTPGNKYLLMVDGYAGAQCNFTIRNWNADNILLGINLLNFSAEAFDTYNTLRWTTSSETNNDYFTVLKSTDGYTWEEIEKIEGAGTSNKEISYETYDQNLRLGTIYYKLKQTDFDGEFTYSNIIVLNRGSKETGIITVAPNPTAGEVTINILNNENEGFITVTTLNGQVVYQTTINNKGIHAVTFDMEDMPQGVYLVNYKDASTQSIRQLVRQ